MNINREKCWLCQKDIKKGDIYDTTLKKLCHKDCFNWFAYYTSCINCKNLTKQNDCLKEKNVKEIKECPNFVPIE